MRRTAALLFAFGLGILLIFIGILMPVAMWSFLLIPGGALMATTSGVVILGDADAARVRRALEPARCPHGNDWDDCPVCSH